jgi:hypothetical protein
MYKIKKNVPHVCQVAPITNVVVGITYNNLAINEADKVQLKWATLCQCVKCNKIVVTDYLIKKEEGLIVKPSEETTENKG